MQMASRIGEAARTLETELRVYAAWAAQHARLGRRTDILELFAGKANISRRAASW